MKITEFVENFKNAKVQNTKINPDVVGEWIRKNLEIKTYIPFRKKREIAEVVVAQNIDVVDGIKKYDSIDGYVSFVVASVMAHTSLEFSSDPVADYDLLVESGLLMNIISEFEGSHKELDIVTKMVLDIELEDNNVNVAISRFLNKILEKLDGVSEVLKGKLEDLDLEDILGIDISEENLTKLKRVLNKYNK